MCSMTTAVLSLDLGRRTPPRPTPGFGFSLDSGRRSPPRPTPRLGLNLNLGRRTPPRPTLGVRLSLNLGGVIASPDLRLGPNHVTRGAIFTLPLASSGYGEQDRRPIWLAPVKQVMMAPRVLHDDDGSQPLTSARIRQPRQLCFHRAQALLQRLRHHMNRAATPLRQPRRHVHRALAPFC
jgi:hypothetical protein